MRSRSRARALEIGSSLGAAVPCAFSAAASAVRWFLRLCAYQANEPVPPERAAKTTAGRERDNANHRGGHAESLGIVRELTHQGLVGGAFDPRLGNHQASGGGDD